MKNQSSQPGDRPRARVASLTDGRLRLKLKPKTSHTDAVRELKDRLGRKSGIDDVRLNHATGSMTVHYDSRQHSRHGMLSLLRDLDVIVEDVAHPPEPPGTGQAGPHDFVAAVKDINMRLSRATGLPIDLRLALPLSFAAAGLWSVARQGFRISQVPGWLYLWMAVDLFVKLHPRAAARRQDGPS
jgi:hypothetical protein